MDRFNLTSFLHGIDSGVRWNSKIYYFANKREDHDAWKKEKDGYILNPSLACDFLNSISSNDFKITKELKDKETEILKLKKELILAKEEAHKATDSWEKRGNEFKEFFDFETWDKTNSEIVSNFYDKKGDEIHIEINQVFLMVGHMASYATVRNRLTAIRILIKSDDNITSNAKELILKHLVLSKPINDKLNERVEKSNNNRIKSSENIISIKITNLRRLIIFLKENLQEYITCVKIPKGEKMRITTYAAIYLGITTGRRPEELLRSGNFSIVKGKNNFLLFDGQAKRKNFKSDPYEIPLLFDDAKTVKKTIDLLRDLVPYSIQRNSKVSAKLNAMFAKDWIPTMTKFDLNIGVEKDKMKSTRSAYAMVCDRVFNQTNKEKISQAGYMGTILGHQDWDTKTYESYYRFNPSTYRFNLNVFLRDFYKNNGMDLKNIEI